MPKALDLTGQIFKGWKVLYKLPSKNGKTYWLCECENCGKQKEIQTNHLKKETCAKCSCIKEQSFLENPKICEICGKEFIPMNKAHTRKYCYECSPHEDENCSHSQAVTIKRKAIKNALVKYKGGKCERCGYDKCMRALEFHHLDPSEKEFGPSQYLTRNFSSLIEEVDKCILVCSNCHAEIHDELEQQK